MGRSREKKLSDAQRLKRWTGTLGLEKNCANLLRLGPNGKAAPFDNDQLSGTAIGTMLRRPVTARGSLIGLSADQLLCVSIIQTLFVQQDGEGGCCHVSDSQILEGIGYRHRNGGEYVLKLLEPLAHGELQGYVRDAEGRLVWSCFKVIDHFNHSPRTPDTWMITIPPGIADNLRHDFTAYFDRDLALALKRADPLAFRLWLYAEAQNLKTGKFAPKGLPLCIFPERVTEKNHSLQPSELLSLDPKRHSRAIQRITKAVSTINSVDSKYAIEVREDKSWVIVFRRQDIEPSTDCSTDCTTDLSTHCTSDLSADYTDELSNATDATGKTTFPNHCSDFSTNEIRGGAHRRSDECGGAAPPEESEGGHANDMHRALAQIFGWSQGSEDRASDDIPLPAHRFS